MRYHAGMGWSIRRVRGCRERGIWKAIGMIMHSGGGVDIIEHI